MEIVRQIKEHFLQTIKMDEDNCYEVLLPWAEDTQHLPDNLNLAKKKLTNVTNKLLANNLYQEYEKVLLGWLND